MRICTVGWKHLNCWETSQSASSDSPSWPSNPDRTVDRWRPIRRQRRLLRRKGVSDRRGETDAKRARRPRFITLNRGSTTWSRSSGISDRPSSDDNEEVYGMVPELRRGGRTTRPLEVRCGKLDSWFRWVCVCKPVEEMKYDQTVHSEVMTDDMHLIIVAEYVPARDHTFKSSICTANSAPATDY